MQQCAKCLSATAGSSIVTTCVKGEKESTAGQEEGKDKFQKAGMFPESMYFL